MMRLLPSLVLLGMLSGCLPARRDQSGAVDDTVVDDAVDDADDATGTTGDVKADGKSDVDVNVPDVPALGCKSDEACTGFGDPCHTAICDAQTRLCKAVALADDATCVGVSNQCALTATCKAGICVQVPMNCEDKNPCTVDSCDPATGCVNAPVTKTCGPKKDQPCGCDDGNVCTIADTCAAGSCGGLAVVCDDKTDCTADACVKETGCTFVPKPENSTCDDGQPACTKGDKCVGGVCKGTPVVCTSDGTCNISKCLEAGLTPFPGCNTQAAFGLACDDGDPCTDKDACDDPQFTGSGSCIGKPKFCDDKNECTDDACDPSNGCTNTPNTVSSCQTTGACPATGSCSAGTCVGPTACNDGNVCTDDACDAKQGCVHTNNTGPCNDGNACTYSEACDGAGACGNSLDVSYDDGNDCTVDSCDPITGPGWTVKNNGVICGGNVKTTCTGGICQPTTPCGDGICGASETNGSCPADCPSGGGQCSASDTACIGACVTKACGDSSTACVQGDDGCAALTTCASACSDAACTLGCLLSNGLPGFPTSVQLWLNLQWCRSAQCIANGWAGKPCNPGGVDYATCAAGCESALCLQTSLACQTTTGCPAQTTCLRACAADPVCEAKCPGDAAATTAAKALLACSMKRCQ